jgi:hypothetical protein
VLAATWLVRIAKRKAGSATGAAALAATLGTVSVVLAPGIRARAASTPHQVLHNALKQALQIEAFNVVHWATIVAVLLLILLAAARMRIRPSWYDEAPLLIRICLVGAIVPLPVLMLTMISYGLGGGIPARLYDVFYFVLAAAVATFTATCGFELGRWGAAKTFLDSQWGALLRSAMMILALVGVLSLPRLHAAFNDIDPAIRNHAVWEQRNAEIWAERNAGVRDVVVSERMLPLTILPFYFDITEDPNWYANQHLKKYFGLQSIRLSKLVDKILSQRPDGVSETSPVQCDIGLNSVPNSQIHSAISSTLTVEGWTAISAKNGIVPDEVFLTLSNANQKLYIKTRTVPRPDVNNAFGQPAMRDSGFTANIDVSLLQGEYMLGVSRVYLGKLDSCSQLKIPLLINK